MKKTLATVPCLWEKLKTEKRPIFLYGTGNGGDKILDVCEKYDIKTQGVFASSGFVRNRSFRGMPVRSIEDIRCEYGDDIIVLLAFGTTLETVINNINEIAKCHTLYIPEVPLYESELFDRQFYIRNIEEIEKAENLFYDEESKMLFRELIEFRLSGDPMLLSRVTESVDMYASLINAEEIETVIDCGAYKGDSATDIINSLHPSKIIALEPDPKTFIKLSAFAESVCDTKIIPVNCAAGAFDSSTEFNSSGSRGSGAEGSNKRGKTTNVSIRPVDSFNYGKIDLIKYDVEGDEMDAIMGSVETIKKYSPALSISVYHRSEDIFSLPIFINKLCPEYRLYLRRVPCIPAWDISLVAIPTEKTK